MSTGVMITGIICATIVCLAVILCVGAVKCTKYENAINENRNEEIK